MKFSKKTDFTDYTPTLNRMGYMSPALDEIQMGFVNFCGKKPSGRFLDVGCGYGIATLAAIQRGCHVVACDLEERHLTILKERTPKDKRPLLTTVKGHFPDEVSFPKDYFDAINFSMVLHFFSPSKIEKALKAIFFSLKEGGKLFLTTSSPYQGPLSAFAPLYDRRKGKEEWPGYIEDIAKYVPHRAHLLPAQNLVFCPDELRRVLSKAKFYVNKTLFFSREGIPSDLSHDGREYSGIICEKPRPCSRIFLKKYNAPIPTLAANQI